MARNPKQDANLIRLSPTEARKNGRKGGKASGRSRGALKTFKEALKDGLTADEQAVMLEALKRNAKRGNLPSLEFLLKMLDEHPETGNNADTTVTIKIEGGDYGD